MDNLAKLDKHCIELSNVLDYLNLSEPFKFEDGKSLNIDQNTKYEISLENVSFRYTGSDKDTISNMNLCLESGEKLAVVGLNGAGKTTLVKLICGFYNPTKGRVLLNGRDIKEINRRDYYKLFTAVFQHSTTLDVTLEENVAQSDWNIDREKVLECIEKAGLSKKLKSLENGLKTHIGKRVYEDGVEFSGGETQRLMLARALYKNAPIIVLDEPTAALDPIAENDIYIKYNDMTKGCSSVFISHRLASTRFCDRIILIENGEITEIGTHNELVELNGKYAHLFAVQSEYYKDGSDF